MKFSNNRFASVFALLWLLWLCFIVAAPLGAYTFRFTASPDEPSNTVALYVGGWQYTNTPDTNTWAPFGSCLVGSTNITIPATVPSPAWLAVSVVGTNYVAGVFTNRVLYNTNALAALYTNNPTPPRAAGPPSIAP